MILLKYIHVYFMFSVNKSLCEPMQTSGGRKKIAKAKVGQLVTLEDFVLQEPH